MAKALSKAQIAALVAEKAGLTKKQAVEILDHVAQLAYKHAKDTFTLPGIGKLTFDSLLALDLPVIMATVMYASFFVVAANAAVDVLHALVDPRIRHD